MGKEKTHALAHARMHKKGLDQSINRQAGAEPKRGGGRGWGRWTVGNGRWDEGAGSRAVGGEEGSATRLVQK